jgi:hypothetical protein
MRRLRGTTDKPQGWAENFSMSWIVQSDVQWLFQWHTLRSSQGFAGAD